MPEIQLIHIPEQITSTEIDEEVIEIFIEEVEEILEEIVTNLNAWKNNPENDEPLKTLRRAFHTLKGSGRMVGATAIGELGRRFENLLNKVINGILSIHDDMLTIIEQIEKVLPKLIKQFQHNQTPDYEVLLLISQAYYLTQNPEHRLNGLKVVGEVASPPKAQSENSPESEKRPLLSEHENNNTNINNSETVLKPEQLQPPETLSKDKQAKIETLPEISDHEWSDNEPTNIEEFPDLSADALPDLPDSEIDFSNDELTDLLDGELELNIDDFPDLPDGEIELTGEKFPDLTDSEFEPMPVFLEEADEIIEKTQSLLERWQAAPKNMQLIKELQRELHTLKGGARMVGIVPMGDLSHHIESVLTRIVEGVDQSNSQLIDIIQNSVDELAAMLEAVRSGVPLDMPEDLIEQINSALDGEDDQKTADDTQSLDNQSTDQEG